ncbi:MAG: LL-diaminopimelate aminotransferase [Stomatobaculum sp.]|nr:LL-diaminopimelate aminotransferase [Stomatobaculum sp.]
MAVNVNRHFGELGGSYLFSEVARRVAEFQKENPDRSIIRMGIGDVTRPIPPVIVEAMKKAAEEMGTQEGFHGYGPEQGYGFLREAVAGYYSKRGVELSPEEIFISDGAKSDLGNLGDIFDAECSVLVTDPVYPAYVDSAVMSGRKVFYAAASAEQGFIPLPAQKEYLQEGDIIFLCSPNNPTGAVMTREMLEQWVDFARRHGRLIVFDAAYECFIQDDKIPHSIFEIEGAKECALEICSFSKKAGFTGLRCGYTVIPKELVIDRASVRDLWFRRQSTRFNGASYITQRAAEAVFTPEGEAALEENLAYYRENAAILSEMLTECGVRHTGGKNAPYIWMECGVRDGSGASRSGNGGILDSWTFFDRLLKEEGVVGTPGAGFGKAGEGFLRLTAFSTRENTLEAAERMKRFFRSL